MRTMIQTIRTPNPLHVSLWKSGGKPTRKRLSSETLEPYKVGNPVYNLTNESKSLQVEFLIIRKMEYRYLGPTGIQVSVISLGNWLNSNNAEDHSKTVEIVKTAWDNGINFFDTAEIYGYGEAERQMGAAIKALNVPRNEFVVSTKIFKNDPDGKPNRMGLSRKHIIEGVKTSLKNLGLTHVDILFAHRPFYDVPMEETCRAFDWVVRKGLAHYWGTSEWDAADIAEANAVCEKLGLIKPIVEQPQYNLVCRERFEIEYERLFKTTGMGTTIWSPLAGGLLTGRYNNGIPADSRYEKFGFLNKQQLEKLFGEKNKQETSKKFHRFQALAKELGATMPQLSMAWCLYNKNVSTAITGASSSQQLIETCKAVQVLKKFTPAIDRKIEEIFQNAPTGKLNTSTMGPRQSPRFLASVEKPNDK